MLQTMPNTWLRGSMHRSVSSGERGSMQLPLYAAAIRLLSVSTTALQLAVVPEVKNRILPGSFSCVSGAFAKKG